jgi:hypothetical protein
MSLAKYCNDCGAVIVLGQDRLGKWYALSMTARAYNVVGGRLGAERKVMILHDEVCPVKILKRSQEKKPPEQADLPIEDNRYP